MSYYSSNNSKDRKQNYSNGSSSNSGHKYSSNGGHNNYHSSHSHQAPSYHSSNSNSYQNKPQNSSYTSSSNAELPNYSRPYRDPPAPVTPHTSQNSSNTSSYYKGSTQVVNIGSLHIEKKVSQNAGQMDVEPKHRSEYKQESNSSIQKPSYSHLSTPPSQTKNQDTHSDLKQDRPKESLKSMIVEENGSSTKIEKEKILDPRQNLNKKPIEKHKIIHEEQDLEVVQKKKKSEAKYGDRLTTLENEIAKIKSKEVQVLKSIISTSSLDISSTESSKKIKSVSQQGKEHNAPSKAPSNYLISQSLSTMNPEQLRDQVCDILNERLKSTAELQLSKQQLITLSRESENRDEISSNGQILEEGKEYEPKKIIHITHQIVRSSDPRIRELEERMEKMEALIQDRKHKTRDAVKNAAETAFEVDVAMTKNEIFSARLKNRGIEV